MVAYTCSPCIPEAEEGVLCKFIANRGYPGRPGHFQLEVRTCLRETEIEVDGSANNALAAKPVT